MNKSEILNKIEELEKEVQKLREQFEQLKLVIEDGEKNNKQGR